MKHLFSIVLFLCTSLAYGATPPSVSDPDLGYTPAYDIRTITPQDLISWRVGDHSEYSVTVGSFGKMGTMTKEVTKADATTITFVQKADLAIQKDTAEITMNKADAKIVKYVHNGKEEAYPDDKVEIISEDTAEVTVPAGTFQSIHVVAKTKQVDKVELWANTRDVVMDGLLKMQMQQQGMDIVIELTSQKRGK
jgi:hypothetical protein